MTSGENATKSDNASSGTYQNLKNLTYEDPLAAKHAFLKILDGSTAELTQVLELASSPNEGRVRQVIARAVNKHPAKAKVIETLAKWKLTETDEFALAAISDALSDSARKGQRKRLPAEIPDLAFTFRYLTGRLRHRALNVLPRAGLSVRDLRDEMLRIGGHALLTTLLPMLDDLHASLRRLERAVDFEEEEEYFAPKKILLPEWLQSYALKYRAEFGTIRLHINFGGKDNEAWVRASPFLLETIFSNLWNNSKQAVESEAEILVQGVLQGNYVAVTLIDNGVGFSQSDTERAFHLQYSTKEGADRGRGHMEVADAMLRLGGDASVRRVPGNGFRVVLTFRRVRL